MKKNDEKVINRTGELTTQRDFQINLQFPGAYDTLSKVFKIVTMDTDIPVTKLYQRLERPSLFAHKTFTINHKQLSDFCKAVSYYCQNAEKNASDREIAEAIGKSAQRTMRQNHRNWLKWKASSQMTERFLNQHRLDAGSEI